MSVVEPFTLVDRLQDCNDVRWSRDADADAVVDADCDFLNKAHFPAFVKVACRSGCEMKKAPLVREEQPGRIALQNSKRTFIFNDSSGWRCI